MASIKRWGYILWTAAMKRVNLTSFEKLQKCWLRGPHWYFLASFFLFVSFLYTHYNPSSFRCVLRKLPKQFFRICCVFCVDVRVFSIAVEWIVPQFGYIREISDGLRKLRILPCVASVETFWMNIESFLNAQLYSFTFYDSEQHFTMDRELCGNWSVALKKCNLLLWLLLHDAVIINLCTCSCYVG